MCPGSTAAYAKPLHNPERVDPCQYPCFRWNAIRLQPGRGTETCSNTEESAGIKMLNDLSMGLLKQFGIRVGGVKSITQVFVYF